ATATATPLTTRAAVAGAIALQTLFAAAERVSTFDSEDKGTTADLVVSTFDDGADSGIPARTADRLRGIPGVEGVSAVRNQFARHSSDDYETNVIVGDCASLRQQARLPSCEDGDVFLTAAIAGEDPTAEPGHTLILGEEGAGTDRWRVPVDARVVPTREGPDGNRTDGVLATPKAIAGVRLTSPVAQTYLDVAPGGTTGDTIELVRNEVASAVPGAGVYTVQDTTQLSAFRTVRRTIFAGTTIVLLLLGASLLVGGLEQLRERRQVLAVLAAFGTRRSTMAWSVLLQAAVPVVLGLSVSLITGIGLGWLLLQVGDQPLSVDWWAVGGMTGVGAAVILLVTALTLPALVRLTSPAGLRTE
ncbi:MAG: ABC transporter permease, partial [Baekduiaceae bacterium]